jgi:hypothetical protein
MYQRSYNTFLPPGVFLVHKERPCCRFKYVQEAFIFVLEILTAKHTACTPLNLKIPTTSLFEKGRQNHPKLGITICLLGKKVAG